MSQATHISSMIFPQVLEIHKWVKRKRSRLTDIVMKDLSASVKRLEKKSLDLPTLAIVFGHNQGEVY